MQDINGATERGNHPSKKNLNTLCFASFLVFHLRVSHLSNASLFRDKPVMGFSTQEDSTPKTMKWVIEGSDLLYLNKAKENSDDVMAADTGLLFKAVLGCPTKIWVRYSLDAVNEHSPEKKEAIITAPSQHQQQQHKETEEEQEECRGLFE